MLQKNWRVFERWVLCVDCWTGRLRQGFGRLSPQLWRSQPTSPAAENSYLWITFRILDLESFFSKLYLCFGSIIHPIYRGFVWKALLTKQSLEWLSYRDMGLYQISNEDVFYMKTTWPITSKTLFENLEMQFFWHQTSNASCPGRCIRKHFIVKEVTLLSLHWSFSIRVDCKFMQLHSFYQKFTQYSECIEDNIQSISFHEMWMGMTTDHKNDKSTAGSDPTKPSTFWEVRLTNSGDWVFLRVRSLCCKLWSRPFLLVLEGGKASESEQLRAQ